MGVLILGEAVFLFIIIGGNRFRRRGSRTIEIGRSMDESTSLDV